MWKLVWKHMHDAWFKRVSMWPHTWYLWILHKFSWNDKNKIYTTTVTVVTQHWNLARPQIKVNIAWNESYIARCASVFAWPYLAGSRPGKLVVDLLHSISVLQYVVHSFIIWIAEAFNYLYFLFVCFQSEVVPWYKLMPLLKSHY